MAARPGLVTKNLSGLSQVQSADGDFSVSSPAEQRDGARRNMLKTMRDLPVQHIWKVWFDRQANPNEPKKEPTGAANDNYTAQLQELNHPITSVQDFWKVNNNLPVSQLKMRDSIYLFKEGYPPIWEHHRNALGGSWTFRVPKDKGPQLWEHVQMLALGEVMQDAIGKNDQICGVGLSVRFGSHLISVWHRSARIRASREKIEACVKKGLPDDIRDVLEKKDACFYKRHSDHPGFSPSPEIKAKVDADLKAEEAFERVKAEAREAAGKTGQASEQGPPPEIKMQEAE